MNKRVLCFTPWFPDSPGGREGNYIFDSVMAERDSFVDMKVLLVRPVHPCKRNRPDYTAFPADLDLKLVRYVSIPRDYFRTMSNKMLALSLTQPLLSYAKKHDVQLIHAHTEALAEVAAVVAEKLDIPCVVTIHGINTSSRYLATSAQKTYFRHALNRVSRVILVGEPLRDYFVGITGRDEHFRIVHNSFHLPCTPRTNAVFTGRILRLISVSNLHEGKGVDLTIRALARLKAAGFNHWHYKIVGDGYLRTQLEELVHTLDLEDQVVFVGAVPHAEVVNYLIQADLFVLPSYREAFGVAYLEAMACGLLAIGVQAQGPSAFIRHGETGFLTAPRDVDDLVKVLGMVMQAPLQMNEIAQRGKAEVVSGFSPQSHAKQLNGVYDELLAEKGF
jgi:glycosyltransferase involved in cell wall biosynthesis